jgi:hypothetical protein
MKKLIIFMCFACCASAQVHMKGGHLRGVYPAHIPTGAGPTYYVDTIYAADGLWDNMLDCYNDPDANYGSDATHTFAGTDLAGYNSAVIMGYDSLNNHGTIDSIAIEFYTSAHYQSGYVHLYGAWKNTQSEYSSTCNDWDEPDNEWGSAGGDSANDGGAFNSGDGTGADRTATPIASLNITGNGYHRLVDDAWSMTSGDSTILVIDAGSLTASAEPAFDVYLSEDAGNPLYWIIYWHE